jgi:Holliday junction resolvase RusA-like endonuclease
MSPVGRTEPFTFWIDGAPYSKANSRRLVNVKTPSGSRLRSIKSENALAFSNAFLAQCPVLPLLFTEDVHLDMDIYYPDRRRDLDESLVLDLMQGTIYANDRQVKSRRVRWGLSAIKPGILVTVRLMTSADYAGGTE